MGASKEEEENKYTFDVMSVMSVSRHQQKVFHVK